MRRNNFVLIMLNLSLVCAKFQALMPAFGANSSKAISVPKPALADPGKIQYISGTVTSPKFSTTAGITVFFNGYSAITNKQGHFQVKMDEFDPKKPLYILFGNATEWNFKSGTNTIASIKQTPEKEFRMFKITIDNSLPEDDRIQLAEEELGSEPPFKDCIIVPLKVQYFDLEAFAKSKCRQAGSTLTIPISLSETLDEAKFRETADKTALFTLTWQAWHQPSTPMTKFATNAAPGSVGRANRMSSISNLSKSLFPS